MAGSLVLPITFLNMRSSLCIHCSMVYIFIYLNQVNHDEDEDDRPEAM